jgi:hypothetical protein
MIPERPPLSLLHGSSGRVSQPAKLSSLSMAGIPAPSKQRPTHGTA